MNNLFERRTLWRQRTELNQKINISESPVVYGSRKCQWRWRCAKATFINAKKIPSFQLNENIFNYAERKTKNESSSNENSIRVYT